MFVGLTAYEFAQRSMPRRTFDPWDVAASAVGAAAAVGLGRVLFFRRPPTS